MMTLLLGVERQWPTLLRARLHRMGSGVILLVRLLPSPTPSIHPAFKKRLSTIDW